MTFWAFQHDQFLPLDQVRLSPADAGFAFGATITDQCRTYQQKPFRLYDHLHRFFRSASLVGMPVPYSFERIGAILQELLERNRKQLPAAEWTLTWLLTPGDVGYFLGRPGGLMEAQPHFLAYSYPLQTERFSLYYTQGATVMLSRTTQSVPASVISPQIKQRSRIHWWMAEREIKSRHPQAHALLLDSQGHFTETASANVLLVSQGKVYSPRRNNILHGMSLQVTEELCQLCGIHFEETDLTEKDIGEAEEAFLSSTPYGIAPIGLFEDRTLPVHGPIFSKLRLAWDELVLHR